MSLGRGLRKWWAWYIRPLAVHGVELDYQRRKTRVRELAPNILGWSLIEAPLIRRRLSQ